MNHTIIIAVVILLILLIVFNSKQNKITDEFLYGMWKANDDFLKKADLQGMMFYIGPPDNSGPTWESRMVYIIMHSGNSIIVNKRVEMIIHNSILEYIVPNGTSAIRDVEIRELEQDSVGIPMKEIMPSNMTMDINITDGSIILSGEPLNSQDSNENIVYAELYKDNISTIIGKKQLTDENFDVNVQISDEDDIDT